MVRRRRLFCLLSALFFLIGSVPLFARAEDDVFFTAVNDTMLPLADETMPFVAGGTLYVAATAFDGAELGVYCSRSREKNRFGIMKKALQVRGFCYIMVYGCTICTPGYQP